MNNISSKINLESSVLKKLEKDCLAVENKIHQLSRIKQSFIEKFLTNKYGCDCTGVYKLFLLYKNGNFFEPNVVRNVLLNREQIHSFDNDKVQNLISSGLLSVTHAWLDNEGEFHNLSKEELGCLLENKDYNPVTGESYDKNEEVWSDIECKFITRSQWVLESVEPILHLNEVVVEDIKNLLEEN